VHVEIDAYPTGDGGVAVFWRDVTERRRAELENAHLAALVRGAGEALFGLSADGAVESWNPAAERLFGHAAGEIIGQPVARLAPPGRHAEQQEILAHVRAGRTVSRETVRVTRDGRPIDVILTTGPVRDAAGRLVGISATVVDITERKRAEAALREREERSRAQARQLEAITQNATLALFVMDEHQHCTYMNPAAERLTGYTLAELRGKALHYYIHHTRPDGRPYPLEECPIDQAFPQNMREQGEEVFVHKDGSFYEVAFTASPIRDAGRAVGTVIEVRDIREAKARDRERDRLMAEADAARREAEAASRAKSEFLAVMSHELRTPLNAIGGYAELLEMGIRGPVTPLQAEDLRRIQTSQRHLLGLINEVLNYARLETRTVHYELEDVRVADALAAAEGLVAPQARAKGLTLSVAGCEPQVTARADADKLRQILVNLLSNAVKFTDRGGRVELACGSAEGVVAVTVRDTGIGIPADQLERIFEPFVQVRADLTRTAEGTGLGLAISRDLARGMGGDLTAESTPGAGSAFTLTLPRASSASSA
jgi:PAS domain S-box-containing protein